jgi:hypothetical protein
MDLKGIDFLKHYFDKPENLSKNTGQEIFKQANLLAPTLALLQMILLCIGK